MILPHSFRDIPDLYNEIRAEVLRVRSAQVLEQLERGEQVDFGPIVLSNEGLLQGANLLPWDALERIRVKGPDVYIFSHHQSSCWLKIPADHLPELELLLTVVEQR